MKQLKFNIIFLLLIITSGWNSTRLLAQENLSIIEIDKLTYDYFNQKKWNELIDLGKQSLKNNIDFYYLQYRMGIAYYNKRNYRKAIPYFENVVSITPEDAIAKEYLYYSYLFGLQVEDARNVLVSLNTAEHREKISFYNQEKTINGVSLNYKNILFDDYAINNTVVDNLTQRTRNSLSYYSVNLFNYAANSSIFDFNLSLLSGKNSIYDIAYSPEIIEEKMKQYQLYFSWNKHIGKGTNLKFGLTYMNETLDWNELQQTTTGNVNSPNQTLIYNGSFSNFASYFSFSKTMKNVDFTLASSFSRINSNSLIQPSISISYFPLGNASLYAKTDVFYQHNFTYQSNKNIVLKQSINSTISPNFGLNIFGLYGKIFNFVDDEGMTMYNNLDALNYWYGASANYYFSNKVQFYVILKNEGLINQYTQDEIIIDNPYNSRSILMGMQFNF
ncbi:tetratricopeptide repeat protein [Yeosuana marina]|uniref:tetratricopeptide repeat protein n=1 Tax=Yeosuana marina TaxID=1565536 RepID=UPI0030C82FC7